MIDRLLPSDFIQDGTLVNKKIIEDAYGHAYTKYTFKYLDNFRHAESKPREEATNSGVLPPSSLDKRSSDLGAIKPSHQRMMAIRSYTGPEQALNIREGIANTSEDQKSR